MEPTSLLQLAQATVDSGVITTAGGLEIHASQILVSLERAGAFCAIAFSAIGAAFGTGASCTAAIASWKKCYLTNKPAPFQLMIFAGVPFSQIIYGMVLMFSMLGKISSLDNGTGVFAADTAMLAGQGITFLTIGIFGGIAMGICSYFQGVGAAGACDALADTGKGFALYLMALGVIETVSIFVMVFAIVMLG